MEANTLSKQIGVAIPQEEAYRNVLAILEMNPQRFKLISDDKILNKVVLSYMLSQVEIYVEKKSETESVLKGTILDNNGSRTIIPDVAENVMLNFENAFSAVSNGTPEKYVYIPYKMESGSVINMIIGFIILVAAIIILFNIF
ncbi:hypothetical protein LJC45_02675 [Alistipes sp. OttesenSCG-928-B03]|nr:hypothetical protein [Alistipes sp. OttesenSCG-928-B03]